MNASEIRQADREGLSIYYLSDKHEIIVNGRGEILMISPWKNYVNRIENPDGSLKIDEAEVFARKEDY